jgi:phosphohistidine phosphatase
MKTLLLMRHTKSSWKHAEMPDHERPLNKRGNKDAPIMGALIKDKELVPQKILCSSALRATETARMVQEESGFAGETVFLDSYYLAEPNAYLEALQTLPDEIERVMVIGHNPGLEGLLQILSGQIVPLSTGAVAHLVLRIDHWNELNMDGEAELVETFSPGDLKEKGKKGKEKEKEKKGKEKEKEKEKGKQKAKKKK